MVICFASVVIIATNQSQPAELEILDTMSVYTEPSPKVEAKVEKEGF